MLTVSCFLIVGDDGCNGLNRNWDHPLGDLPVKAGDFIPGIRALGSVAMRYGPPPESCGSRAISQHFRQTGSEVTPILRAAAAGSLSGLDAAGMGYPLLRLLPVLLNVRVARHTPRRRYRPKRR